LFGAIGAFGAVVYQEMHKPPEKDALTSAGVCRAWASGGEFPPGTKLSREQAGLSIAEGLAAALGNAAGEKTGL